MNVKQLGKSLLELAIFVVLATGMAFGRFWPNHKVSEKVTEITLESQARIQGNTLLAAGRYKVEIPLNTQSPEVAFMQDGRTIARVKANVVEEKSKNAQTEVLLDERGGEKVITQIRPEGLQESLVFSKSDETNTMGN